MPPVAYHIRRQQRRSPACKTYRITVKYFGLCKRCGCELRVGDAAYYSPVNRWLICLECCGEPAKARRG